MLLCYAAGGECAAPGAGGAAAAGGLLRVVFWNARGLGAAVTGAKREWLAGRLEAERPAVVVVKPSLPASAAAHDGRSF